MAEDCEGSGRHQQDPRTSHAPSCFPNTPLRVETTGGGEPSEQCEGVVSVSSVRVCECEGVVGCGECEGVVGCGECEGVVGCNIWLTCVGESKGHFFPEVNQRPLHSCRFKSQKEVEKEGKLSIQNHSSVAYIECLHLAII